MPQFTTSISPTNDKSCSSVGLGPFSELKKQLETKVGQYY